MELEKLRFQNRHWDNVELLREDIQRPQPRLYAGLPLRFPNVPH